MERETDTPTNNKVQNSYSFTSTLQIGIARSLGKGQVGIYVDGKYVQNYTQ
jgi:hypothetical protein